MNKELINIEGHLINPYMIIQISETPLLVGGKVSQAVIISLADDKQLRLDVVTLEEVTDRLVECGVKVFGY